MSGKAFGMPGAGSSEPGKRGEKGLLMEETRMIDLHMHSTVSDGSDSPAQLLERGREMGL